MNFRNLYTKHFGDIEHVPPIFLHSFGTEITCMQTEYYDFVSLLATESPVFSPFFMRGDIVNC